MGKEHHHHHHHQSHGTGGFNILQISLFLCMHWCKLTSTGYCGKKGMTHYEPDIIIWHFMMPLRRKVVLSSLSFQVLVSLLFDFDYDRYVLGWKDFNITNLCCQLFGSLERLLPKEISIFWVCTAAAPHMESGFRQLVFGVAAAGWVSPALALMAATLESARPCHHCSF